MLKKRLFIGPLCIVLAVTTGITIYAVNSIIKQKNEYQLAAENGKSSDVIKSNEDFKYSEIKLDDVKNVDIEYDSKIESPSEKNIDIGQVSEVKEFSSDAKINIYHKMLNSIDYYNNVFITMETSMIGKEPVSVEYQVNIDEVTSYQGVKKNGKLVSETYSTVDNMIQVNNSSKTLTENYLPTYTKEDAPYIELDKRIITGEDGIPTYYYRKNITNCPYASYTLVPQEIAFSYLKDFDKWSIVGDCVDYLGRKCVKIVGKPSPYIAEKHNIDSFTMLIDGTTGILMSFEGTLNGELTNYITVTACSFEARSHVKQFDINNYSDYSSESRSFTVTK